MISKIEQKLDELELLISSSANNDQMPTTTLSEMLLAQDDAQYESSKKRRKLTREEIVENVLLLLVAGTETTASTLTMAIFLLGLHKDCWSKVVAEQKEFQKRYPQDTMSKKLLDPQECPYLDAVVKETMRLVPLAATNPRRAKQTMIMNGKQIPKGWAVWCNIRLTH